MLLLPFQNEKRIGCDKWIPKNWKQEEAGDLRKQLGLKCFK